MVLVETVFVWSLVVSFALFSDGFLGTHNSLFQAAAAIVDTFELLPAHAWCSELFPCLFAALVFCVICHVSIVVTSDLKRN